MEEIEIKSVIEKYEKKVSDNKQIVTVFVLTHKRPYYLKIALDSILKQTYPNYCLVVLDNMSCDDTREMVESIDDGRLLYVERDGSVTTSNSDFAFEICKTKYLVIFHDDDIVSDLYLEKMIKVMESNPSFSILSCGFDVIDENGNCTKKATPTGKIYRYTKEDYLFGYVNRELPILLLYPTIFYRKSFFDKRSKYADEKVGPSVDDYMYFQIGRYGGTLAVLDELLFHYRRHSNQDSSQNNWWMGLKLLNYMFAQDYYVKTLAPYYKNLSGFIDTALARSIQAFSNKNVKRKDLKHAYGLIPDVVKKANKKSAMKFYLFANCPRIMFIYYKVFRKNHYHNLNKEVF